MFYQLRYAVAFFGKEVHMNLNFIFNGIFLKIIEKGLSLRHKLRQSLTYITSLWAFLCSYESVRLCLNDIAVSISRCISTRSCVYWTLASLGEANGFFFSHILISLQCQSPMKLELSRITVRSILRPTERNLSSLYVWCFSPLLILFCLSYQLHCAATRYQKIHFYLLTINY